MYPGKIKRPDGVPENEPYPHPMHNPLPLSMQVKWTVGGIYTALATAKLWVTIKSSLAALDSAAEVHMASDDPSSPFVVDDAARGMLSCVVPGASMDGLVVGTTYYIDIQMLHNGEPYTLLYDTLRPFQQVTKDIT